MKFVSLAIPYLYLLHVLVVSIRVGATLLFAPIWGYPGLPQPLRIMFVFSIAAGMSAVLPFNPQAYQNPGLVLPTEFLIGLLLSMGIRIAFAGLQLGGQNRFERRAGSQHRSRDLDSGDTTPHPGRD